MVASAALAWLAGPRAKASTAVPIVDFNSFIAFSLIDGCFSDQENQTLVT
jgi:hypothetical protein